MEPIAVSRPLLFGLVAVGALVSVAAAQPASAFAAGFAAGAGAVFVLSFMRRAASRVGGGASGSDREEP